MRTEKMKWQALFFLLLALQVGLIIFYGGLKAGYHEDEYYSYYSTNRTAGLVVPDREWVDRESYRNEFVVLENERFNYDRVKEVQAWDVHPPLFYFLLHTVSSFFPGIFSKWIGISVNIAAFCINFFLLAWLSYMVTDKNKKLTLLICAVSGFNAAIISGVMFIRMYEWLTLFVLLCACLHIRAVKRREQKLLSFYLPLMAAVYLGFLTQYYYLIFHVFIGIGFCLLLLIREKKIIGCLKYGAACGIALFLAILTYPASVSHIFRGYRGTGAASEFLNAENTGERIFFFADLMNDYLFDGWLPLFMAVLAVMGAVVFFYRRKKMTQMSEEARINRSVWLLLIFACAGYFFTVSKTALLLYETSNRYQLPIYPILLMLVIAGFYTLGRGLLGVCKERGSEPVQAWKKAGFVLLCCVFLIVDMKELAEGQVLFLYREEQKLMDFARENADVPAVVMYQETTPYHVWWCSGELLEHERIYFMKEQNQDPVDDEVIRSADKLIVYAAEGEEEKRGLELLLESSPGLTQYRLIDEKSLFHIYLME